MRRMRVVNFGVVIVALAIFGASPIRAEDEDNSMPNPDKLKALNRRVDRLISQLPKRPVMSGKDMPTKLGLLYLMGDRESQGMLDLADSGYVPIVKTGCESADRSWRVVQHNPKAIWIVSGGGKLDTSRPPKDEADDHYKRAAKDMLVLQEAWRPRVNFQELTPCMWEPKDATEALWYSNYLCDLLPRFRELGPRPIVLNSGVGGLPVDKPNVLEGMAPGLRLAHHLGGAWGCHGYTLEYTMDVNAEAFLSLRYRKAYDYFKEHHPELADFPMILLEGGVDKAGDENKDGWLARGTLEKYQQWLDWYDKELMKDDYVLGVTLFKIGAPTIWKSFELEPVVPWLFEHYKAAYGRKAATSNKKPQAIKEKP